MASVLMMVLSYDRDRGGGSVRLTYELATGLASRGHRITVLCEDMHEHGTGCRLEQGVTVLRYRLPPARGVGFRRHAQHIQAARQTIRQYAREVPEIVHGHSLFQYVAGMREYRNVPCMFSIHSPVAEELRVKWQAEGVAGRIKTALGRPIVLRLEREALQASRTLIAESGYTRQLIAGLYGSAVAGRISVIPGWADVEHFRVLQPTQVVAARVALGWPTDRPVFFVLRRLEVRMGLDNLLRALAIVRERGYAPYTAIGGAGPQLAHLRSLRAALGLDRDVTFMGFVPRSQLSLAYAACDASVIPTAHLECFGIIALEALACGRPVLVTPVGALPEIVNSVEPHWIGRDSTPAGIADLLCRYLDGQLPRHDPESLRATVRTHYSFENALNRYEEVLLAHC
jgi:glycosyltransferase involved in cell wall biosynthesis